MTAYSVSRYRPNLNYALINSYARRSYNLGKGSYTHRQCWGLRQRSYDKTSLRLASVLVLVLYFWSCCPHWYARRIAKRDKYCKLSTLSDWWISRYILPHLFNYLLLLVITFWCFCTKLFLIANMRIARGFFRLCRRTIIARQAEWYGSTWVYTSAVLLLFNWSWSSS